MRAPTLRLRPTALFALAALVTVSLPAEASARCVRVAGRFSSEMITPPDCESPVGVCTAGQLSGLLRGGYSFVADQFLPTGDPSIPMVSFYTGQSVIDTRWGTIFGTDAGAQTYVYGGEGPMSALLTVTGGTGWFGGVGSGYLQITGVLDYATGLAEGRYSGQLCW